MPTTISTMFQNLSSSYPALFQLVFIGFWLSGFIAVVWGVNNMRASTGGGYRGDMSSAVKGSLVSILIGAGLMYMPTLLESVATSIFNGPSPVGLMDYQTPDSTSGGTSYTALRTFLQLVGVYFFGRGWLTLRHVGVNGEGSGHSFYGGAVRIFAGICLVHIVDVLQMLALSLGLTAATAMMQKFGG